MKGVMSYHPKSEVGSGYKKEIGMMAAKYSITKTRLFAPDLTHTLTFSARRKNFNLILKQTHNFSLSSQRGNRGIWPNDILNFPLRICAHHTTDTAIWKDKNSNTYHCDHRKQVYSHRTDYDTSMLSHAVTTAFQAHKRIRSVNIFSSLIEYCSSTWLLQTAILEPSTKRKAQTIFFLVTSAIALVPAT